MACESDSAASQIVKPGCGNLRLELRAIEQLAAIIKSPAIPKYLEFNRMKPFTICLPPFRLRFIGGAFLICGSCTFLHGWDFRGNHLIGCDHNVIFSQTRGRDIPATLVIDVNLKSCFWVDVFLDLRGPVGQDGWRTDYGASINQ